MKNNVLYTQNAYKCQVLLGLGSSINERLFYSLILLIGFIWQVQPNRNPALTQHFCPRDLPGTTEGTRIRTAHLLPLPSKQNLLAKRSCPPSSQESEKGRLPFLSDCSGGV